MSDTLLNSGIRDAETTLGGVGVVQEIDSAAMSLWLSYRHIETSLSGCVDNGSSAVDDNCFDGPGVAPSIDDFQYVKFGGLINF